MAQTIGDLRIRVADLLAWIRGSTQPMTAAVEQTADEFKDALAAAIEAKTFADDLVIPESNPPPGVVDPATESDGA